MVTLSLLNSLLYLFCYLDKVLHVKNETISIRRKYREYLIPFNGKVFSKCTSDKVNHKDKYISDDIKKKM